MVKTSPFHGGNPSSNLGRVTKSGSIAQLGERLPYKQDVTGSSPVVPTKAVEKAPNTVLFFVYKPIFKAKLTEKVVTKKRVKALN